MILFKITHTYLHTDILAVAEIKLETNLSSKLSLVPQLLALLATDLHGRLVQPVHKVIEYHCCWKGRIISAFLEMEAKLSKINWLAHNLAFKSL